MNVRVTLWASMLGIAVLMATAVSSARAQGQEKQQHVVTLEELQEKQQHVVTLEELHRQAAQPAERRQSNENDIRHLLSSEAGQKVLKDANIDYQRVDKAIGQLSDDELARLADRSRQAESDFAAGFLSPKTLAYIILIVVVIVVIAVLV